MNEGVKLTKRESEIAELFAWGATKKDVANRLFLSVRTVENHARNIFEKIGCSKVNELSAWWFCTTFHISFDLSPFKRRIIATCLLAIVAIQIFETDNNNPYMARTRTTRTCRVRSRRKTDDNNLLDF